IRQLPRRAPRLLAFLESRRGFGVFAQALLDLLAEPIENELRRALMDRSLRLPPPEHMPQPIELRIRLMPGR
ncbi:hypothetical protein ACV34F_30685, partial [Pseudomonas aeruginosa]